MMILPVIGRRCYGDAINLTNHFCLGIWFIKACLHNWIVGTATRMYQQSNYVGLQTLLPNLNFFQLNGLALPSHCCQAGELTTDFSKLNGPALLSHKYQTGELTTGKYMLGPKKSFHTILKLLLSVRKIVWAFQIHLKSPSVRSNSIRHISMLSLMGGRVGLVLLV